MISANNLEIRNQNNLRKNLNQNRLRQMKITIKTQIRKS